MRVIVAGGRDFGHRKLPDGSIDQAWTQQCWYEMSKELTQLAFDRVGIEVVSGMADGADTLGVVHARTHGLPLHEFPADWDRYDKAAGYLRNEEMAKFAAAADDGGALCAFWDGQSKGTKHMIDLALKHGLEVHVYRYEPEEERF